MITGDYGLTAESIARRVGMLNGGSARILTGAELDALNDAQLDELIKEAVIYARMAPEHKLRLVDAFQRGGHVVAVIGDGVNDAPALRKADVGIAMGVTGTDVAREAADVILTRDDFGSVVKAVEEGRAAFDNLRKFITYIFASNIPEIMPFLLTALFRIPLALTVTQVLAIDLGTDLLPALALGMEKPEPDVMTRPPRNPNRPLVDDRLMARAFLWLGMLEAVLCFAGFFWVYDNHSVVQYFSSLAGRPLAFLALPGLTLSQLYVLSTTMFFAGVVTCQVGNAFACRSEKNPNHLLGWGTNVFLLLGVAVELLLMLAMVYIPSVAAAMAHMPLPGKAWVLLVLFGFILYGLERARKIGMGWLKDRKIFK
jgi:Ca2+-transporting ATPase